MLNYAKYVILLVLFFSTGSLSAASYSLLDTIPPVFTSPPQNETVSCDDDVVSEFISWLDIHALAEADNGEAQVMNLITNDEALSVLEDIRSVSCSGTGTIEMGFVAVDSCNNFSIDSLFATFSIEDNIPPVFDEPASDVSYDCHYGILDSLQQWLDNTGFASITDNCSDTISFTNYSWADNLGNTGFSEPGVPTNIVIERTTCLWSVDVTFFVEDECGNINVSSATFSLSGDNQIPDLIFVPLDTIIQCSEAIPDPIAIFVDGCDGELQAEFFENSTQSGDSLVCTYYNYEIVRTWSVKDACNNEASHTQSIMVRDTVGPEAFFQGILALDCDTDLTEINAFINITDNCHLDSILYSDSIVSSSPCQTQILRNYTATDICQNESMFQQTLQIQDFSAPGFIKSPVDTVVECSDDVIGIFNSWIDSFGFAIVEDNCNMIITKALNPGVYSDTMIINNADVSQFNIPECPPQTVDGILGFQIVEFVVYDICGNINTAHASFTVIDTIAPQIVSCPQDLTIDLESDQCDTTLLFLLPDISDNCLPGITENYHIEINSDEEFIPFNDSLYLNLFAGENDILYQYRDCGGNSVSCIQNLLLLDHVPPVLSCPDDITIFLEDQKCLTEHILNPLDDFFENCASPVDFINQQPEGEALVSYYLDSATGIYSARNTIVTFRDIQPAGLVRDVRLKIEFKLDLSMGSSIELRSELGDLLYTLTTADCSDETIPISINENQFNFWLTDGRVNFTIVHSDGSGDGTLACNPGELNGPVDNDGESYLRLVIEYSDINPEVQFFNTETDEIIQLSQGVAALVPGSYAAEYFEQDAFDNTGSCFYNIEVIDNIEPQIICKDIIVEAPIQASPFYNLNADELIQSISDNCAIDTVLLSQNQYSCIDIGTSLDVFVEAFDVYGNSSGCNSIVTIKAIPLDPDFLSNLCFADTLQLFANVDSALVQSYRWTGPANFTSEEANPLVLDIDNSNSGVYFLTVTTRNGCLFFGSLDITVNEFSNPLISSDTSDYCVGDNVLLNASIFTEQVDYLWYEGISPNGLLLEETDGPSLSIQPTAGKHFYYVEVRSEFCNSNPSATISIDVLPVPVAEIDQAFITICEGDEIVLSTSVFSSIYNYEWTGPNGYFSRERIPEVIEDADFSDQGSYFLTIDNGICTSDTASVQVTIFEKPQRPEITGQSVFCEGQTAILNVQNIPSGIRYHWLKDGQLFNSVSTNSLIIPLISEAQTGDFTVVVEDGICLSDTSEVFTVAIEPKLTIGATNNGPVCQDDEVLLTCSFIPNATYLWEDPSGELFGNREVSVPATEGIYTVTVTTNNNCTAVTSTKVEVDVRPSITALSNSSLNCMSEDMEVTFVPTVFPEGDYVYEWSGPDMFHSNLENPVISMLDTTVNGIYTLQVIKGNCASDPVNTEVDLTIIPEQAIIELSRQPCEGDTFEIQVINPTSGQDIEWLWTTPFGLVTTSEPMLKVNGFNNNFVGNYSVIQSLNGCRSVNSAIISLEKAIIPEQPIIDGPSEICEGDQLVFSSEGINGAEYVWITPNGQMITDQPVLDIENINPNASGIYAMYIQLGSCRSPVSDIINLHVTSKPIAPAFPTDSLEFCLESSSMIELCLELSQVSGNENFILINRQNGQIILEQDDPCFDLTFLNTGIGRTYILAAVTEVDNCQSELSNDFLLVFEDAPVLGAKIVSSSHIICGNTFETVEISNPYLFDVRYSSPDSELIIIENTPNEISVSNLKEGTNQLILTSSYRQCIDFYSDTTELLVINGPVANDDEFTVSFSPVIQLDILQNDELEYSLDQVSFSNLNHGNISYENDQVQYVPVSGITELIEFDYTLCYELCPNECDTAHVTLNIEGNDGCIVGNVLTPNGDGYNDHFEVSCLSNNAFPDNSLSIYNQWGDEIYSASPYLNDWDGSYDGQLLPSGSYFYILNLGDNQSILQGFIIIEL